MFQTGFALELEDRVQDINMNNPECRNNNALRASMSTFVIVSRNMIKRT